MPASQQTADFIRATFRSVWSLELLLYLKQNEERRWPMAELVERLRASESVVSQGVVALVSAGLISLDGEGARYRPASEEARHMADQAEALYAKRPDAVRRMIVLSANGGLAAFAEAFRLRKD